LLIGASSASAATFTWSDDPLQPQGRGQEVQEEVPEGAEAEEVHQARQEARSGLTGLSCTFVQECGTFVHVMLAWIYLSTAIASEVIGTVFLRFTDGFTNPLPSALVVATYALSLWLTALALRQLEISLAYAVWAGVGTAAVAVIGMAAMGESVNALKLASIALVIGGVVGLNLSGAN
jgi:small multidrug resistance pump